MDEKPRNVVWIGKICRVLVNIIEIYIPAVMLLCLFLSFIVGIVFRYIFRNPQAWTFELSSIAFLQFAILSGCFVQRKDEHIVFDMIYEKMSKRMQCIMRILSGFIICLTVTCLIPTSITYVSTMLELKTQMLKWPRWCIFVCFPVSFTIMDIRSAMRMISDIIAFKNGTYCKVYPKNWEEGETP